VPREHIGYLNISGRLVTRYPRKKSISTILKANILASTSLKEFGVWGMNKSKLCVPSPFPLSESKFESSWEQQDFAESGSPTLLSQKP
jgi:hypothetical protein